MRPRATGVEIRSRVALWVRPRCTGVEPKLVSAAAEAAERLEWISWG
ncbi:MAG: hypothetical protein QOI78_3930 [Actinomycetota bacterium]|jgi:hypothetical protein|nr:hypothetical protein [Actinomycetota bacterium]